MNDTPRPDEQPRSDEPQASPEGSPEETAPLWGPPSSADRVGGTGRPADPTAPTGPTESAAAPAGPPRFSPPPPGSHPQAPSYGHPQPTAAYGSPQPTRPYPGPTEPAYGPPVSGPPQHGQHTQHTEPRKRRGGLAAGVIAAAIVAGAAAGVGGSALYSGMQDDHGGSVPTSPVVDAQAPKNRISQVAAKVLPSVVKIEVTAGGTGGSGSGVIISGDGRIITNEHVVTAGGSVSGNAHITVSFNDGSTASARVLGTDPLTDTAVIKAEDVSGLTPATIGKSDNLQVGQTVVAVGSPFGLESTVTSGIVSALDRPVNVGSDGRGNATVYPAIQTDAAINPGNSGGALVDGNGNLVGINASIRTSPGTAQEQAGNIGLGFAIPIDEVMPVVKQMSNGEQPTHAKMGVSVRDATTQGTNMATGEGALVADVTRGSAADDLGLQKGDVITQVDDHRISTSDALVATVRAYRPGDKVTVKWTSEDGDKHSGKLTLDAD